MIRAELFYVAHHRLPGLIPHGRQIDQIRMQFDDIIPASFTFFNGAAFLFECKKDEIVDVLERLGDFFLKMGEVFKVKESIPANTPLL